METEKVIFIEEISAYCAYCDTLTWQEKYQCSTGQILICKSCNMEAMQLILFPGDDKETRKKMITSYKQDINKL